MDIFSYRINFNLISQKFLSMRNNDDQISAAADSANTDYQGNKYGDSFVKMKTNNNKRHGMIAPHPVVVRALLQIIEGEGATPQYGDIDSS